MYWAERGLDWTGLDEVSAAAFHRFEAVLREFTCALFHSRKICARREDLAL